MPAVAPLERPPDPDLALVEVDEGGAGDVPGGPVGQFTPVVQAANE